MRILFMAHRLPYPPNKGDKIRSFWELRALARRHEVDVFCFYDQAEDENYIGELQPYCRSCYAEKLSPLGSRARALGALAANRPFSTAYFYSPTMAERVRRALHSTAYDLAFVFSSAMAPYVEKARMPKILDLVDVDSDKWRQYASRSRAPLRWLWNYEAERLGRYEQQIANSFSRTLLCTEAEARIFRQRSSGGNLRVLENSLDLCFFDPATVALDEEIASWQPYVVFTGSLEYFPNCDAVHYFYREIYPLVRRQFPELKFVVVGRNVPRSIQRLASDPGVRVTGSVADTRRYLRGAAASIAPMRVARGVQNKILEAMAMGLPVVTTPIAAAALPQTLVAELRVAADASGMAAELLDLLRPPRHTPVDRIRQAITQYVAASDFDAEMEALVSEAVGGRARVTSEAHRPAEVSCD